MIETTLASVLSEENHWSEGKEVAQPGCFAPSNEHPPAELLKLLYDQHLCSG